MADRLQQSCQVPGDMLGMRFDQAASRLFPDFSRARLQEWIRSGQLTLDGRLAKPKDKLLGGESLALDAQLEPRGEWQAEALDLPLVYEDETLVVVDKPAGLVVHPAAGNPSGTLLNALLHHCPQLEALPRAGIVHRLDKDTTGLMVVAKTLGAHADLVAQLQRRSVSREYQAVVLGCLTGGGRVDAAIGRHPRQRKQMAVVPESGKPAVTHYRLRERFEAHSYIDVKLETGRTHQIRVHMAHIRHPLVGDTIYAGRFKTPKGASDELVQVLKQFPRQALHAARLGLEHPVTGEPCQWDSPLPEDFQRLLEALRRG